jgi:hypothetical protein
LALNREPVWILHVVVADCAVPVVISVQPHGEDIFHLHEPEMNITLTKFVTSAVLDLKRLQLQTFGLNYSACISMSFRNKVTAGF